MNKEEESERFKRLAEENPITVYDAIESSEEPWWGFGILTQPRMSEIRDDNRITELINLRYKHMIDTISTSSEPWLVTWNMQSYEWFMLQEETIAALAQAIRSTHNPHQLLLDLIPTREIMKSESIRSAILHALENGDTPAATVSLLRDFPDFVVEPRVVDVIAKRIGEMEEFWLLVDDATAIRGLLENPKIRNVIISRLDDLVEVLTYHEMNWQIVPSLVRIPFIIEDTNMIEAIAKAIRLSKPPFMLIYNILLKPILTEQESIQSAISERLQEAAHNELWEIIGALRESRILTETKIIQDVIRNKLDFIANTIMNNEVPHKVVERLASMDLIMNNEGVQKAIAQSMKKIIKGIKSMGDDIFSIWYFFENTIWIPAINSNQALRKLIAESIVMTDRNGNYVGRFGKYPTLINDEIIQKAILQAIRKFDDPAWFVCALEKIPEFLENQEIVSVIEERIPRIIQQMQETDENEYLTEEISNNAFLMKYDEVRQAVFDKVQSSPTPWKIIANLPLDLLEQESVQNIIQNGIDDLSARLWNYYHDTPYWSWLGILRSDIARDSAQIKKLFDDYLDETIADLECDWQLWYSMNPVRKIPYYAENPQIQSIILNRSKDIVHALTVRNDCWYILNSITEFDELLKEDTILEGIRSLLCRCYDPWEFLDVENIENLLQDDGIREILIERIPDIVFGITSTVDAPLIVENISKADFLKDEPRISQALEVYTKIYRL